MVAESLQPNVAPDITAGLGWRFWLLIPLTGTVTGLAAGLLMKLLRATQHLAWPAYEGNFLAAVEAASWGHRLAVLTAAGLIAAAARWLLRQATGGHGGELAAAIWFHAGRLPFFRTLLRAVVSIVVVGMGASLGREAAPKQVGAAFASLFARWISLAPAHRKLLVACGAGAGIGAVYNVPLGGALFALEVLLGSLALPLIVPALSTSLIATAVSWLLLPNRATYDIPSYAVSASLLACALFIGPLAGIASALYVRLICRADARKPKKLIWLTIAPVAVFLGLGALSLALPQLLGNGRSVVQLAFTGQLTAPLLLLLIAVLKPIVTAACLGSGAPGGLFTPTLTFGAAFGALIGQVWSFVWPGVPSGCFALVGGASVLAAATQGPVSAIVLVLELTRRLDATMVPIMLGVGGAVFFVRLFEGRSVYSGRIHLGRGAVERSGQRGPLISAAARYDELLQTVLRNPDARERLKVVDETGAVVGEIAAERVRRPAASDGPLEMATAGDFVSR